MSLKTETTFKVGDRVRFKEDPPMGGANKGDLGTVVDADPVDGIPHVRIKLDKGGFTWPYARRVEKVEEPQPVFKIGDRVRTNFGDVGTVVAVRTSSIFDVKYPGIRLGTSSVTPGAHTYSASNLTKIEPKFKAGDIVQFRGSKASGYKVLGPASACGQDCGFDYRILNLSYGNELDVRESEIWLKPSQEFKLKRLDKVKNLKTGRVGYVNTEVEGGPLFVYTNRTCTSKDPVPAKALEAWEAEHPGTYDIVVEDKAPW